MMCMALFTTLLKVDFPGLERRISATTRARANPIATEKADRTMV